MDISRFTTLMKLYRTEETRTKLNEPHYTLVQVAQVFGSLYVQKTQKDGATPNEYMNGTVRMHYFPELRRVQYIETVTYYGNTMYEVRMIHEPYLDGEVLIEVQEVQTKNGTSSKFNFQ